MQQSLTEQKSDQVVYKYNPFLECVKSPALPQNGSSHKGLIRIKTHTHRLLTKQV